MAYGQLAERLKNESPELFANYEQNISVLRFALQRYKKLFPYASDYSIVHSIEIIEMCERLIGEQSIGRLSADDCYCLLMAAYLQFFGFGVDDKHYEEFLPLLEEERISERGMKTTIQANVAFFSVCMIEKYGDLFEFPSELHKLIITNLVKVNDIANEISADDYYDAELPDGDTLHLTYIAAVLKLAERLSELTNKNVDLTSEVFSSCSEEEVMEMIERMAVAEIGYVDGEVVIGMKGSETVSELIKRNVADAEKMLSLCTGIIKERTDFDIQLKGIRIERAAEKFGELYLNQEIEESWDEEDREYFEKFSEEEKIYYLKYLSAEYGVTKNLKEFSEQRGTELAALEFRVKSPKSVYNKLHLRATTESMLTLGDTIRYTAIFPVEDYCKLAKDMLAALEEEGWHVNLLWNAWLEPNLPYNGINVKLKNEDGFRAELQFHTQDSYDIKMSKEDHELYEKRRMYEPNTKEYMELLAQQFALYDAMQVPPGIENVK